LNEKKMRKKGKPMAVNGQHFLDSAKKLIPIGDEISYRNCVSRAYYAMYHETRATLQAAPNFAQSPHDGLIRYLKGQACRGEEPYAEGNLRSLASLLAQQKGKRHKADYSLSESLEEATAKEAIFFAEKLFQKCQEMKKSISSP